MSLEAFIESKLDDDNYEYNFIDLHALGRNMTQAKYGSKMEVSEAGASDLAHIKKELGELGFKFVGRNVTKNVRGFRAGAHGRNPFAGSGGGGTGMGSAWGNPTGFSHGGGPGAVGVFSFPLVFIMTDVIGEVYGKKLAKQFVLAGFISTALFIGYSLLSLAMPWSTDGLWAKEGYNLIFGVSARIAIASLVAFAIGEYQDVFTFFLFKKLFQDKYFWLRSNLSNIWSQFLDTVIFMLIATLGSFILSRKSRQLDMVCY
jgi:uncharacterized integral membrane protein (TIGR00697 family)